MLKVNALGDPCPIPVVKTKNAIKELSGGGRVETLVDNEIAVQNLTKMAVQKGYGIQSEKLSDGIYRVVTEVGHTVEADRSPADALTASPRQNQLPADNLTASAGQNQLSADGLAVSPRQNQLPTDDLTSSTRQNQPPTDDLTVFKKKKTVVVISSDHMGEGNDALGRALMKGFLYALSKLDDLPDTILFYNGGAGLTVKDSPALLDIQAMEAAGVEILTCGTCLNHYGLTEQLAAGSVTNMYAIADIMMQADHIMKP